ncbi:MAG: DUF5658 family protein [Phycisphaerales bacterium]
MAEQVAPRPLAVLWKQALYPDHYAWYVLASSLDVMVTYFIIWRLNGREVNSVANHLVQMFGHWGLIMLKFSSIVLVVAICEWVGRQHFIRGRRLAIAAIAISALPVGVGLVQILAWVGWGGIE